MSSLKIQKRNLDCSKNATRTDVRLHLGCRKSATYQVQLEGCVFFVLNPLIMLNFQPLHEQRIHSISAPPTAGCKARLLPKRKYGAFGRTKNTAFICRKNPLLLH